MNKTKLKSFLWHVTIVAICAIICHHYVGLEVLLGWLIFVNIVLFSTFGIDKYSSKKKWRRTPESTFLWLAFLGGFPALFLGRKLFRHKTLKKGFIWPMWLLFISQLAAALFITLN